MTLVCRDLDDALRDGGDAVLAAARSHAASCPECHERLEAWEAISAAAPSLRKDWPSPGLWPRIEAGFAAEARRPRLVARLESWRPLAMAASAALVLGAFLLTLLLARRAPQPEAVAEREQRLLTERALAAVERSETDYVASIDALAGLAKPLLEKPDSPLLSSYREKLAFLDAAIAECRAQIERNRFNAHLRRELLSIYQEKQRTLQKLMEERS
jgi:anti-sigma factor RsiW